METNCYICNTKKLYMEAKSRFKVKLSNEAQEFLDGLPNKVREKIISNIRKSTFVLDPDLFKKLDDTDIWEFRTFYNKTKYRLLAFWDKGDKINTLVIATHGFIKKTQKTPLKEIAKAEEIRKDYFNSKRYSVWKQRNFIHSKKSKINTSEKKVLPNVMPTKKNLTLF